MFVLYDGIVNCPGFARTIRDFNSCLVCPRKKLQCSRFYEFEDTKYNYKKLLSKCLI